MLWLPNIIRVFRIYYKSVHTYRAIQSNSMYSFVFVHDVLCKFYFIAAIIIIIVIKCSKSTFVITMLFYIT